MKILVLLFLCSFSISQAQTSQIIFFDTDGKVSTKKKSSHYSVISQDKSDTTLYATETFYSNNQRRASGSYRARVFPVSWEKMHVFDFIEAFREGVHKEYFENGQVKFQGNFKNGNGEGEHRRWYESGQLLSEVTLVSGRNEGEVKSYYPNGKLKMQYSCTNGLPEGELQEYYENGKKKAKALIKNGFTNGESIRYDESERELLQSK